MHPRFALAVTPTIPAGKPRRTLAARALAFVAWLATVVRTASQRVLGPVREVSRRREALRVYRAPLIPAPPEAVPALCEEISSASPLRRPGHRLGNYELLERLDAGGMGEVWRARHVALGRAAAVKLIRPELLGALVSGSPDPVQRRFEREAQTTASLRSPHTVQIYDFGRAPDGTPYYAMELLGGLDLNQLVARGGPIAPERAVHILRQVCHSLAEAHGLGLIHRDIKPGNIRITAQGGDFDLVKVLDFGLVRRTDAARDSLAGGDVVCGTPGFLAPEAIAGDRAVDARADLYAVGAVAFRMLTATPVFSAADSIALLREHLTAGAPAPSTRLGRALPVGLDELVTDLLARDPARRPASATEVLKRLEAIALPRPWNNERAESWWREHAFRARDTDADPVIAVASAWLEFAA